MSALPMMSSMFTNDGYSEHHQFIQSRLQQCCQRHDFADMAYCVDCSVIPTPRFEKISDLNKKKTFSSRKAIFYSSNKLSEFYNIWSKHWIINDNNMRLLPFNHYLVWQYHGIGETQLPLLHYMKQHGYHKKVSMIIPGKDFNGRFSIFIKSEAQLEQLENRNPQLMQELEDIHFGAMFKYGVQINPLIDLEIIKPKTLAVLKHLQNGCKRADIAKRCNVSERGVDYHIDLLKDQLQANNMAQLIAHAKDKRLI